MDDKALIERYLRNYLIKSVSDVMHSGYHFQAMLLMVQSCEALGAVLDDKPLKATQQSRTRFLKVFRRFPKLYFELGDDDFWYEQLRNSFAHLLIPGASLKIVNQEKLHLSKDHEGVIQIYVPAFYEDFLQTFEYFIKGFSRHQGKIKKLNFKNIDDFV